MAFVKKLVLMATLLSLLVFVSACTNRETAKYTTALKGDYVFDKTRDIFKNNFADSLCKDNCAKQCASLNMKYFNHNEIGCSDGSEMGCPSSCGCECI